MDSNLLCPACKFRIQNDWFFCPTCGNGLKEIIPAISISKQILIYSVSFFLSPLGLVWGLKYAKSKDSKTRTIGFISIILTVLSIVLMSLAAKSFIDQYSKLLNNLIPLY